MKHITPHLWFDKEAKEAADFYVSVFENSKINNISTMSDTPSGDTDIVSFEIEGQPFIAISAGPVFKFNPSISFILNFDQSENKDANKRLNEIWQMLAMDGRELMPLAEYPFSKLYGWIQDKYGVSWQLMLTNPEGDKRPFITPSLMFAGELSGKAEEAIDFYCSIFEDGKRGFTAYYPDGSGPDKEGTIMFADFYLLNTWLAAMDSGLEHDFTFNEAISLLIPCYTQEEIDYYWEKLAADPESGQCGWLKDKFGVSWQVWPIVMGEMMSTGTSEQVSQVAKAFLPMKKINISELEKAFRGK